MYANQGCLCPTQGAAAAQDDFLLTAASATYSICMDSSVITGVERCCCCQRFVNVRTSKQSSTRWCISVCVLLLCVCGGCKSKAQAVVIWTPETPDIYKQVHIYAFFIHASLPCYITILLVYLSCMLVQKNVLLLLMNALSLLNNQRGRRHWLVKLLLFFS